jgi:hypothetical protein
VTRKTCGMLKPALQQQPHAQRTDDHEQRVQDVVGRDDAGAVRGLAADLDERVHGHAVDAGKQREQGQVRQHAPVRRLGDEGRQRKRGRRHRQAARCEVQVDGEHAHADGAQRHQADLHMPAREHLAQQRTGADADGKHHQQQRSHLFVAMQHIARKAWKLRQEHRAEEPHPRNAQQRAEDHHVAMRQLEVAPGFGEGVPVDDQARVGGWRHRHPLRQHRPNKARPTQAMAT